jgi:capsular exopolysaccharide synthesis family protein
MPGDSTAYARTTGLDSVSLAQYWQILKRRKGKILLIVLLSTVAALLLTRTQLRVYRARTLLEIQSLNEDFLNKRNVSPTASEANVQSPEYNIRTQTIILQSKPVLERAIGRMNLQRRLLSHQRIGPTFPWSKHKTPEKSSELSRALSIAVAGLRVRIEPNTRIVEVSFDSTDRQFAADFVNSIATSFIEVSFENRLEASRYTSEWLARQLEDVKTKLEKSEDALQQYARVSGLTFISQKDNAVEEHLRQLQAELSKAQADRIERQSKNELATSVPSESLPEVLDNPTLKEYQVQLTTLRRQLADLSSSFTREYPKVVSIRAQIAALEEALRKEQLNIVSRTRNEYNVAALREKLVSGDYEAELAHLSKQGDKIAHYSVLKREVDNNRQLYDSMAQRVKEADLASAMRAGDIHVIESASPPGKPYKPSLFLNTALGFITGLCISVGSIVQRARSYRGIQEPGDIALELKMRELGVIPSSSTGSWHFRRLLSRSGLPTFSSTGPQRLELTSWQQSPSVVAESFRLTLTSILFSNNNGVQPRVIAVSSANPREGKSTVISNLAIALARINRRVLLIDGDMRKPRLHEVFDVDNSSGLSEMLAGESFVAVRETKIPNLFLLPSGKSKGDMLFFTSQLSQLLLRLKTEFDMILIDTPPLLRISDARLIAHYSDAVVLVVAQHTARDTVFLARQRLIEDGSRILGTILNNWDSKATTHRPREYSEHYASYCAKE